jgi:hypothetical protein
MVVAVPHNISDDGDGQFRYAQLLSRSFLTFDNEIRLRRNFAPTRSLLP